MKYRVVGQNRDSGARQTLEFESDSKAAAERKAQQAGMNVTRVEVVTDDGGSEPALETRSSAKRGKGRGVIGWVIFLVLAAAMFYYMSKGGKTPSIPGR